MMLPAAYKIFLFYLFSSIFLLFGITYGKSVFIGASELKSILRCAIVYLGLTAVLFIISLPAGILFRTLAALILTYYLLKSLREISKSDIFDSNDEYWLRLDWFLLFFGLLAAAYAGVFWGRGGTGDWLKHRSILYSLFSNPLNPQIVNLEKYSSPFVDSRLVYYYSLYLPGTYLSVILFKLIEPGPLSAVSWALSFNFLLWLTAGMALGLLLLPVACVRLFGENFNLKTWSYFFPVILVFSGLNFWTGIFHELLSFSASADTPSLLHSISEKWLTAWRSIFHTGQKFRMFPSPFAWGEHAEWWTPYFAQISSFISLWQWAPQHLASGLITMAVLFIFKNRMLLFPICIWSVFLLSSSLFCWIGTAPLFLFFVLKYAYSETGQNRRIAWLRFFKKKKWELMATALLTATIILFYAGKKTHVPFNLLVLKEGVMRYLFFLCIELIPVFLILLSCRFLKFSIPTIVWICLVLIAATTAFQFGKNNDLAMRATVPALLILISYCSAVVQQGIRKESLRAKALIIFFLILMTPPFINEFVMGLKAESRLMEYRDTILLQYAGSDDLWSIFKGPGSDGVE